MYEGRCDQRKSIGRWRHEVEAAIRNRNGLQRPVGSQRMHSVVRSQERDIRASRKVEICKVAGRTPDREGSVEKKSHVEIARKKCCSHGGVRPSRIHTIDTKAQLRLTVDESAPRQPTDVMITVAVIERELREPIARRRRHQLRAAIQGDDAPIHCDDTHLGGARGDHLLSRHAIDDEFDEGDQRDEYSHQPRAAGCSRCMSRSAWL